jgi:hypothetical protein
MLFSQEENNFSISRFETGSSAIRDDGHQGGISGI